VIYELLSQRGHRIFIRTTEKDHSFAGVISRVRLTNRSFGFVYSATPLDSMLCNCFKSRVSLVCEIND
jgi:hypothetical protein